MSLTGRSDRPPGNAQRRNERSAHARPTWDIRAATATRGARSINSIEIITSASHGTRPETHVQLERTGLAWNVWRNLADRLQVRMAMQQRLRTMRRDRWKPSCACGQPVAARQPQQTLGRSRRGGLDWGISPRRMCWSNLRPGPRRTFPPRRWSYRPGRATSTSRSPWMSWPCRETWPPQTRAGLPPTRSSVTIRTR